MPAALRAAEIAVSCRKFCASLADLSVCLAALASRPSQKACFAKLGQKVVQVVQIAQSASVDSSDRGEQGVFPPTRAWVFPGRKLMNFTGNIGYILDLHTSHFARKIFSLKSAGLK